MRLASKLVTIGFALALIGSPALSQAPEEDAKGHHRKGMQHDFSDAERWTEVFDRPDRDSWQKPQDITDAMAIEPGMTVADIGAGTGYFLSYLSQAVGSSGRVLALDPEKNLVEFMKDRVQREGWKNVSARVIPYDDPGLDSQSTDRILIVDTWHHIQNRPDYAKKLADRLKPGGALYVVDFTLESSKGPSKKHRLSAEALMGELEAGGFEAQVLSIELPYQYLVEARPIKD